MIRRRIPTRRFLHHAIFRFWQALDDYPALPYVIAFAGLILVNF